MNGAAGAGRNEPATESLVVDQVAASHDKDLESGLSDENSIVNRDMPAAAPLPNLTPSDEVAKEEAATNIVSWDGEHDEDNPMNWKSAKKWRILAVVSMMTFVTPLASSMFAPAVPQVLKEFHVTNDDLGTWAVSIYVLGFAVGPLVVAPMSEMYGRRPVYIIACILFLAFTIGCAASSSLAMLVVFRFLAGCAGATPNTLGGATIGDLFPKEKRGAAMAVWGLGPMLGPAAGPVIGGFLSQAKSWRWAFWLQAIIAGVILILGIFLLRETYAVAILSRKTKRLIRETGNINLVSALHDGIPTDERFQRAIVRPMKLLIFSPIVLLLSIWVAVIFGYLYLYITTFPTVFQTRYGFSPGVTGLTYLGLGIGFFLGLGVVGSTSDIFYRRLTARNNGVSKPEFRLPPMAIASPFIAVSLFWYGWSAEARAHWIVPIIGTSFFGIGMMPSFVSVSTYLVDAYEIYSAAAIAASRILQSVVGAVLPLAGPPMFDRLGLGWGNSVLAFIALAFVPVPWFFFRYGELLRNKLKVKL